LSRRRRRRAEEPCQTQGGIRRDGTLSIDDTRDPIGGDAQRLRKRVSGYPELVVALTLHTPHASGTAASAEGRPGIIGLNGFISIMNKIKRGAEQGAHAARSGLGRRRRSASRGNRPPRAGNGRLPRCRAISLPQVGP